MTVYELYTALNEKIPPALSCEWDNDGMMCVPDPNRTVRRILVALDATQAAEDAARAGNYDVILTHHPLIFKGVRHLTPDEPVSARLLRLASDGISVLSFHTRLDAVAGGVNDTLAALLALHDTIPFGECDIGRVGTLAAPMDAETFAGQVKRLLGAPFVLLADAGAPVCRVAVMGGEGGDDVEAAKEAGADTYLSGRLGYHTMTDAPEGGMNLIEAGHFYTENPVCATLQRMVKEIAPDLACDLFFSGNIRAL